MAARTLTTPRYTVAERQGLGLWAILEDGREIAFSVSPVFAIFLATAANAFRAALCWRVAGRLN